ncbi:MAG: type III pantothenate kinase [Burkholderiaceae bacterium]|nr:type III pantothenate kinase [Burkholderiaceae bacterium]MCD8565361.1 type III pantothenate kinase [Burkholderiaceae bacterium]
MKLLIDIGNTRLKLATLQGNSLQFVAAIPIESADQLQRQLQVAIESLGNPADVCVAVSVSSVQVNQAAEKAVAPKKVQWIASSPTAAGVTNAYPDPSQLGTDRWVGMIGLTRHFATPHPPIVLASFGTATTVDTLGPDNQFRGGLILPGVSLMHDALANGTARLPNAVGALAAFPTDTLSAITSGIVAAQAGAVLRQIELARQAYSQQPVLCVTGGAWLSVKQEFDRKLGTNNVHELPHVVLDGLAALAG